jgi:hypothetical protein
MAFLGNGDGSHGRCNLGKALLVCNIGKLGVHVLVLVLLAVSGLLEVLKRGADDSRGE